MEITPSLGSLDLEYSRVQNDSDLRAQVWPYSWRAKVTPWQRSAWRTRNRAEQIMTTIRLHQEKKTCSHMQRQTSTQCQKSDGPSQRCDNMTDGQSRWMSNIADKIIIKEGKTWKVFQRLYHLNRKKEGRERDWGLQTSKGLLRSENWIWTKDSRWIWGMKIPKERLLEISSHR